MPKNKLKFKIVTMEKVTYEDEIDQVTVPTEVGEITVLAKHAPLVSILKSGELKIKKDGYTVSLFVSGGFLEIRRNSEVYVLADVAERVEEINEEAAREAMRRAQEMQKQKQHRTDVDFAKLQAIINREVSRLKIAEKHRRTKK